MDEINKFISEKIKKLLNQRNWSVNYLAKRADINYTTLQSWVKGKSVPSIELITKLCNAFDISLSEFFLASQMDFKLLTEQELLNEWKLLNSSEQSMFLALLKALNNQSKE